MTLSLLEFKNNNTQSQNNNIFGKQTNYKYINYTFSAFDLSNQLYILKYIFTFLHYALNS